MAIKTSLAPDLSCLALACDANPRIVDAFDTINLSQQTQEYARRMTLWPRHPASESQMLRQVEVTTSPKGKI